MRYRLRTLLIVLAILPPMLAGMWLVLGRRPMGSTTINGSQVIVLGRRVSAASEFPIMANQQPQTSAIKRFSWTLIGSISWAFAP